MTVERYLRLIAGAFVMLSVALGYFVHPAFFLFTAFVGLNLFQSGFTDWCPMMAFLKKLGVRSVCEPAKAPEQSLRHATR
jgi:Inner membrane protein YgaP-like, transmembrane domain